MISDFCGHFNENFFFVVGSAAAYKKRWCYLRDSHAKYLRESRQPGKNPPYFYLAKAMEFLNPYIRPRKRPLEQVDSQDTRMNANGEGDQETIAITDDESNEESLATTAESEKSSGTGWFISVDARNEDAMFLLSVLPSLRQMSAERKKQFKISLIQACDRILE